MDTSSLDLIALLDRKNAILLNRLYDSEVWRLLATEDSTPELVAAITRNLLRQVLAYGSHVMVAISTSIGRLASSPEFLTSAAPLSRFLLEEITHPNMAGDSYLQLGGKPIAPNTLPPAPAVNLAAVARFISEQRHPLAIMGVLYLFECTTADLGPHLQSILERHGFRVRFVEVHAKEDVAHANHLREMILRVSAGSPEVAQQISAAYDCFSLVYPAPVWDMALELAFAEGIKAKD